MTSNGRIENEARALGLRLRLGLARLGDVEPWADRRIVDDDGTHTELVDLCMSQRVGEARVLTQLASLGGAPAAQDIMRVLGALQVEEQTQDDLRRLADNLDPLLQEMDQRHALPDLLRPALRFAAAYWRARVKSEGTMQAVGESMREWLSAVKEHAAQLPDETGEASPASPTTVAAIVVSYRTGEVLFDCLNALLIDPDISEIVLVDNGNEEDAMVRVKGLVGDSGKLKVIGDGVNRGFAAGVNLGVKASGGNRLLIINPDAVLQPSAVAALEDALRGQAEPVIIGGKIHDANGVEQRGGRRRRLTMRSAAVTFLGMGWLKGVHPGFVDINRHEEPDPSGPVRMDAVSGALMYMSRTGFERLGGFDEGYFLHVEDVDLCRRAEADGGSVIYTPLARALHHGGTSEAPAGLVDKHKAAGLARYFRKFAETPVQRIAVILVAPLIGVALLLRARLRKR